MPLLSTAMQTAAQKAVIRPFVAVRVTFSFTTLCLLDASGVVSFAGTTFVGEDANYGTLANVDDVTDGGEDEAPRVRVTLNPRSLTALSALASASNQGSKVEVWEGLLDNDTGLAVSSPELVFEGFYDQPQWLPKTLALTIDCGSVFEDFFDNEEGARLTDSYHQSIWPGELGFQYVFETEDRELPWGSSDKPRPVATRVNLPRSSLFNAGN